MPTGRLLPLSLCSTVLAAALAAGESKPAPAPGDLGPFLCHSFLCAPGKGFNGKTGAHGVDSVPRGVALRLAADWSAGVIIDGDTLRVAAGWLDAPMQFVGTVYTGAHGPCPGPSAAPVFTSPPGPGWADAGGSFADPRPDAIAPQPRPGPLPRAWARYAGVHRHGKDRVVVALTVGTAPVLESWAIEGSGAARVFARSFTLGASSVDQAVALCAAPDGGSAGGVQASLDDLRVAVVGAPAGAALAVRDGRLVLALPKRAAAVSCKVLLGRVADAGAFAATVAASPAPADLTAFTKGGGGHLWSQTIATTGKIGIVGTAAAGFRDDKSAAAGAPVVTAAAPYVVDALALPVDNPWKVRLRTGGFDFFADGKRAALATWEGDVWIVSGIDDKLDKLSWRRFASGNHQPLGLKIVGDVVHTVGNSQLTRYHDHDGDGECDFQENLCNEWQLTTAFHAFCFDLHTDPAGDFLFAFGAPVQPGGRGFQALTAHHGCVLKVARDGSACTTYATGLRAPNGIGVSPSGQVTTGDNQGTWVPASPLNWVKAGGFVMVSDTAQGRRIEPPKPLCWFPYKKRCNSGGSQVWVTSERWGPFAGDLLYLSYGTSRLYKMMYEEVDGVVQGGGVEIPLRLTSSAMRARFNPVDGQLYLSGLKGWQTNAVNDGSLDRVRFTGGAVRQPTKLRVSKRGIAITYTCELDAKTAADPGNYSVKAWNYLWSSAYGSAEIGLGADAKASGSKIGEGRRTDWPVQSCTLIDPRTVLITVPAIEPVMQVEITAKIAAADGAALHHDVFHTIHVLPAQ